MKYRDFKQFGAGEYYHIYNRGNAKQDIFIDDEDFLFFLLRLRQNLFPSDQDKTCLVQLPNDSFTLVCYCLMPNHFHLLIRQNTEIPTSKLLNKICTSYSIYFNKKYNRVGHVFQDQFKQIRIDNNDYLLWLSAYIHQNPKVAGLVENIKDWRWSNYSELTEHRNFNLCNPEIIISQFTDINDYCKFVENNFENIRAKKEISHLMLDMNYKGHPCIQG